MGGDFCYVLKLSEQRAGVFIADVMGHGSRSALVTAILATLMQNVARRTEDPGRFLELINREFHRVARVGTDPVFATAFYLVLDTGAGVAAFATAGHPPPIVAERSTGAVAPVMPGPDHQPALGLFPESTYRTGTRPLRDGDLFFLFTDGAPEAEDADGQPFGTERMRELIGRNLRRPVDDINGAIVSGIAAFAGRDSFADDLCLVGVEVLSAGMARAGRGAAG
jgi:serine phosphatase RsbU (regulator of sigma subunit)